MSTTINANFSFPLAAVVDRDHVLQRAMVERNSVELVYITAVRNFIAFKIRGTPAYDEDLLFAHRISMYYSEFSPVTTRSPYVVGISHSGVDVSKQWGQIFKVRSETRTFAVAADALYQKQRIAKRFHANRAQTC